MPSPERVRFHDARPRERGSVFQATVVEGVHRIENAYSNWSLRRTRGLTIVDCGVPSSWQSLTTLGRRTHPIAAVVLTHAPLRPHRLRGEGTQ